MHKKRMNLTRLLFSFIITIVSFGTTAFQKECSSSDIMLLKNEKLQKCFFIQLDSIRKVQYPNTIQGKNNTVDLTPKLLRQFLKDINIDKFKKNGTFENYYFFNLAPPQFKDSKLCKDRISLHFIEASFSFRIEVENIYMVGNECIGGSQVSYSFKIIGNNIVNLSRNEAG